MQKHIDPQLVSLMGDNAKVNEFVASLNADHISEWARPIPGLPGEYELPVDGFWIRWKIDQSGMETIIKITLVD